MTAPFDFVRSHGLGNDYLVMDPSRLGFELTPDRIRLICHRNLGVGSDGILLLVPVGAISNPGTEVGAASRSHKEGEADFAVRILNPDGSEAEKSGNGLRIFAKFLYDHGYTNKTEFTIYTLGGIVNARLILEGGRVVAVRVDMGRAVIDRKLTKLAVGARKLNVTSLSVGNPHCVTIVDDLSKVDLLKLGPLIENHKAFPNRTNVQFAQVLDRANIRIEIWERGAGNTLASGSSASAASAVAHKLGLVDRQVTVHMPGGQLSIDIGPDYSIRLTGPVIKVAEGMMHPELFAVKV